MSSDKLFNVVNNFYLGAYQSCINDGLDLVDLTEAEAIERDVFVHRAYIAIGQASMTLSEVPDSAPTALAAVKLLARYSAGDGPEEAVSALQALVADPMSGGNPLVCVVASTVFLLEGAYDEALKACSPCSTLEMHAVMVQAFLKMHRVDMAEKALRGMQSADDDATLTQLATAWVDVLLGGLKVQEAFYIYQELGDKFSWTPRLYNGSAACNMAMGKWDEAEKDLLEALNKDAKDPETLANLVTCSLHLGKPAAARYQAQLKQAAPQHALAKRIEAADDMFSRAMVQA